MIIYQNDILHTPTMKDRQNFSSLKRPNISEIVFRYKMIYGIPTVETRYPPQLDLLWIRPNGKITKNIFVWKYCADWIGWMVLRLLSNCKPWWTSLLKIKVCQWIRLKSCPETAEHTRSELKCSNSILVSFPNFIRLEPRPSKMTELSLTEEIY